MASLRSVEDDHRRIRSIVDLEGSFPPTFPSMDLLRILFWNCRGAGNNKFKCNLVELIKLHKPEILILMETKVAFSTMNNFFNSLGFTASSTVDPVGRMGGIWIVWDTTQVNVRASSVNSQAIHATVHKEDYEEWVLAAVYASPNPTLRDQMWHDLTAVATNMKKPWLVAGDFNDYANQGERRSYSANQNSRRTQKFIDRINSCNLIDLGSTGPRMTWTNNRKGLANTMERLDRAMCNAEWRTMFPEATVRVLPRTYLDHSPLVVYTQGMHSFNPHNRPFRFEAAWMSHPGLIEVVKSSWHFMNNKLLDATAEFTHRVNAWNKEIFGNIFKRKRRLLARIEGIQKVLAVQFSHNLQHLENDLIKEYNETLLQEEMLWFQKSRAKHITLGDKNTRYFHISTINKRRKLKINALKNDNGIWISDTEGVKNVILDYFKNLFSKGDYQHLDHWANTTPVKFTKEDNDGFLKPLSNLEIFQAVKDIGAFKAPGKDGIPAIFYHKYWNLVGKSVCDFINLCFHNNSVPDQINETIIVLIPKIDNPENIKQFRPISLCNVTYKIISKIIVGRLRPLLDSLVSHNQCSFIPGRSTTDNIIITQEILHTLRHKKGRRGGMIFKIDLEKAYDRLSWEFIRDTLIEFNMNENWIHLIMSCVTNTNSVVLWNGEILEGIKNERGLRQGDPLSPYLFVLCMERLSNMINSKVNSGQWQGIKAGRNSPPISHLFFADDLILFATADQSNCEVIMGVISEFCDISGHKVNYLKSKLFVSPNLSRNSASSLSSQCGIPLTQNLGKYLGSPMLHGRVNRTLFRDTMEKLKLRLSGWKARNLSLAGRTTLIQSVTSAIPSYNMQTMELPRRLCDDIDRLNRNFLWGETEHHKKVHLVSWDSVCRSKADGGLGIRKARDQNAALLTKLGWNMLRDTNKLWCKVLHSKYLQKNTFFNWPLQKRSSHVWKSICKNRDYLKKGVKWNVGNGEHISLWCDWWCGKQPLAINYISQQGNGLQKVSSVLDDEGNWDIAALNNLLTPQDVQEILTLHRPRFVTYTDAPVWAGSNSGNFTTSSAYKIIAGQDEDGGDWKWLWKIRAPQKLKCFIWLILKGRLLTNHMRLVRNMSTSAICPRCGLTDESLHHLLRECSASKTIWTEIKNITWWEDGCGRPLLEWITFNLKNTSEFIFGTKWQTVFISALWQIWTDRNKTVFENLTPSIQVSLKCIRNYAHEIEEAYQSSLHPRPYQPRLIHWLHPPAGKLKLNVDGCSKGDPGQAGYGGLLRDETGIWIWGFYGKLGHCTSLEAELWAIYRGLTILFQKGTKGVEIESDSELAIDQIQNGPNTHSPYKALIEDARFLLKRCDCLLRHTLREGNRCADKLASLGVEQSEYVVLLEDPPEEVKNLVIADMTGVSVLRD
ncbi:unnamed protein product [Camellia sinensis]